MRSFHFLTIFFPACLGRMGMVQEGAVQNYKARILLRGVLMV
jgi:hypothetical protein